MRLLILAAACLAILAGAAQAATLRIQSLDGPGTIATAGLERLADELRSESAGEIDIEVLPVGRAVGPTATLAAMASGAIDGHYSAPAYFARLDPAFAVLGDTLALYPDPQTRDRWFSESRGIEYARKLYERYGARLVGIVYWPQEWLVAAKPASILADLSGMTIRAPDGPVGDLLARAGARVVAASGRETLHGLAENRLDAADWAGLASNLAAGAHESARFAIRARHSMPVTEISVSSQAWSRLSPKAQRLFEAKVAGFSKSQRAAFEAAEAAARGEARARGITLLEMSPSSQAALRRLSLDALEAAAAGSTAAADIAASHRAFLERLGLVEPAPAQAEPQPKPGAG